MTDKKLTIRYERDERSPFRAVIAYWEEMGQKVRNRFTLEALMDYYETEVYLSRGEIHPKSIDSLQQRIWELSDRYRVKAGDEYEPLSQEIEYPEEEWSASREFQLRVYKTDSSHFRKQQGELLQWLANERNTPELVLRALRDLHDARAHESLPGVTREQIERVVAKQIYRLKQRIEYLKFLIGYKNESKKDISEASVKQPELREPVSQDKAQSPKKTRFVPRKGFKVEQF